MSVMSRREMFRAGGMLAVSPIATGLAAASPFGSFLSPDLAATSLLTGHSPTSLDLSPEIGDYLCQQGAKLTSAARADTVSHRQISRAGKLVDLAAAQVTQTSMDKVCKAVLAKNTSSLFQADYSSHLHQATTLFQKYDPEFDPRTLPVFSPISKKQADMMHAYMSTVGVSGTMRGVADFVHLSAHYSRTGVASAAFNPSLHEHAMRFADLRDSDHAHLLRVCEPKKPAICNDLLQWAVQGVGGALALLAVICLPPVLAGINVALPGIGIAVDAACALAVTMPYAAYLAVSGLVAAIIGFLQFLNHC